jgi:hypothetical protein
VLVGTSWTSARGPWQACSPTDSRDDHQDSVTTSHTAAGQARQTMFKERTR